MTMIETPRFPDDISYGSLGGPNYSTDIVTVQSGFETRNVNWLESRHSYDAAFGIRTEAQLSDLLSYFHAMQGRANTFRFKDWGDFNSTRPDLIPAFDDQTIGSGDGSTVIFQLSKNYTQGLTTQRDIKKPVVGTTLIGIAGVQSPANWSINTTTGLVTFDADISRNVTGATSANPTVITFATAPSLSVGESLYLSGFTGAWAALNNQRYTVTAIPTSTTYTIAFNASAFAAYSSNGGAMNTIPQTGEAVTAGYEFDVACRFDTDSMMRSFDNYSTGSTSVPIVEIKV